MKAFVLTGLGVGLLLLRSTYVHREVAAEIAHMETIEYECQRDSARKVYLRDAHYPMSDQVDVAQVTEYKLYLQAWLTLSPSWLPAIFNPTMADGHYELK